MTSFAPVPLAPAHTTSILWSSEFGFLDEMIDRALTEDLSSGDVTSRTVVPPEHQGKAQIIAKQPLVVAGLAIAAEVFLRVDRSLQVYMLRQDCSHVEGRTAVLQIEGRSRSILAAERTALNLLQRACGIATLTRSYVDAAGDRLRIVDTRKTMPCLRSLDRYAVRCGGGYNHRNDLGAGVLIKENHIACAGSVRKAVIAALRGAPHTMKIECEVQNLSELQEAIDAGAHSVLLDNMDDEMLRQAVAISGGRVTLEASGGITLERISRLAEIGVDIVSIGAITHSVRAADLSLLIVS